MQRNNRLEAIQEGKFLSLRSDVSVASAEEPLELDITGERPFVVPEYDPEGSIYKSRHSKYLGTKASASQLTCPSSVTINESIGQPDGKKLTQIHWPPSAPTIPTRLSNPKNAGLPSSPANPPPYSSPRPRPPRPSRPDDLRRRTTTRISRLSITPSFIDAACLPPNTINLRDLDGTTIISQEPGKVSPMHIVKLPNQSNEDLAPPDGGTLAWLQCLAGFFVIMDAQ